MKIGIQSHLHLFKEKNNYGKGDAAPATWTRGFFFFENGQGDLNATILPPCDVTVTN